MKQDSATSAENSADVKSQIISDGNGHCCAETVHVSRKGIVNFRCDDFSCTIRLTPPELLDDPNNYEFDVRQHIPTRVQVGKDCGTITVKVFGGPCNDPDDTGDDDDGPCKKMRLSPNQIIIDS